jgi:hypothetical protein
LPQHESPWHIGGAADLGKSTTLVFPLDNRFLEC